MINKHISNLNGLLLTLPIAWIAGLLVLATRARLHLGHWPRPSHPDPKNLPFSFHHETLWVFFYPFLISLLVAPVLILLLSRFYDLKTKRRSLKIYFFTLLCTVALFFRPIDFILWFLD